MTMSCHSFVMRAVARKLTARYDTALIRLGISAEQWSLISLLNESGPLSISELAEEALLERSTVGRNVRVLHAKGWVDFSRDNRDGRLAIVVLTSAGNELSLEARVLWMRCQAEVEQIIGQECLAALKKFLITESYATEKSNCKRR